MALSRINTALTLLVRPNNFSYDFTPTLMFPLVNITDLIKGSSLNIHEMWDLIFVAASENKARQYGRIKLI